jgi:hypothetical protein
MAEQKLVPISLEELGRFSVGEQDKALYLDGGKVQTTSISLTTWQARLGIAAAIAAVIGALSSAAYTIGYYVHLPPKQAAGIASVTPAVPSIDTVSLGCIGPFASGKGDVLETTSTGQRDCDTLDAIKISLQKEKTPPSVILFIGAADKFPASLSVLKLYGSNNGLAQARAEWVASQLGLKGSINPGSNPTVLSLVRGPSIHGIQLSHTQRAPDRSVAIYALRMKTSLPAGSKP